MTAALAALCGSRHPKSGPKGGGGGGEGRMHVLLTERYPELHVHTALQSIVEHCELDGQDEAVHGLHVDGGGEDNGTPKGGGLGTVRTHCPSR